MTRLLFVLVCAAAVAAAGCDSGQGAKPAPAPATPEKAASAQPAGPPPEAPAAQAPARAPAADPPEAKPLPEEPAAVVLVSSGYSPPPKGREVDNSRCHVCHGNFTDEPLAVSHAKNGVGCERCHGACDDHCSDEGNITPPTTMYAREKIDKSCQECHPDPMERIVADARYCLFVPLTDDEKKKVCTECHGAHLMNVRTVHWDKKTGELLSAGGVKVSD